MKLRGFFENGRSLTVAALMCCLWFLTGCQEHIAPSDMTFNRGAQLLSAGSPQSAIPFLTQTVTATPDGPEPLALLALAYALDGQAERAIAQSRLVKRVPGDSPGWENVAIGIAEMTRHRPEDAVGRLQQVASGTKAIAPAARQWLVMAHLMNNDLKSAVGAMDELSGTPGMRTTALLWKAVALAHERDANATATLVLCAQQVASSSGKRALAVGIAPDADDQTLYDTGIAALANRDLATARRMFTTVQERSEYSDAPVWLSLISAIQDPWQTARNQLKTACENGSAQSRGVANQLFSVVCAMESRPDAMILHTLAGQRILNRTPTAQPVDQPPREEIWYSDRIKQ